MIRAPDASGAPPASQSFCVVAQTWSISGRHNTVVRADGLRCHRLPISSMAQRTAPPCCRRDHAMDPDSRTRAAIEEHWRASERGDTETEHAIYAEDGILDYPQSGERFRS